MTAKIITIADEKAIAAKLLSPRNSRVSSLSERLATLVIDTHSQGPTTVRWTASAPDEHTSTARVINLGAAGGKSASQRHRAPC